MPTINLNKKKKEKRIKETDKRDNLNHKAVYNTRTWRKLRLQFLMEHPLCQECLKEDKITSAIEVHHIIPISSVSTIEEKKTLGFNWNNLKGLCDKHHKEAHKNYKEL